MPQNSEAHRRPVSLKAIPTESPMPTVDKGVTIPTRGGRNSIYPFADMEVGDSFFTDRKMSHVSGSLSFQKRHYGRRFSARTVTENGVKGTRVWRVE